MWNLKQRRTKRTRLNLKPRTAPISDEQKNVDKPNPFGRAKPVDVREAPEGGERKAAPKVRNDLGLRRMLDPISILCHCSNSIYLPSMMELAQIVHIPNFV